MKYLYFYLLSILFINVKGDLGLYEVEKVDLGTYSEDGYIKNENLSWEQWCTDACALRSPGGYRKRSLISPKSSDYPSNCGISQVLADDNCYCQCPVPADQDSGYNLCKNLEHSKCNDFCSGRGKNLPVTPLGGTFVYLSGSCVEDPQRKTKRCTCNCATYDLPME